MKNNLLIVANWKSNKTTNEAGEWVKQLTIDNLQLTNKEVVVCPPFTLLPALKSYIINHKSPIKLGAQNISPFGKGAFTGEVNEEQIKEFAEYVIIGHSERRKNFNEEDNLLNKKVHMAISQNITPIFCIWDATMNVPSGVTVVAYEPLFAIGSGNADTPENAQEVAKKIKDKNKNVEHVLYGGSVTPDNVSSFTQIENIDGVLVGGKSLDASEFLKIIQNA